MNKELCMYENLNDFAKETVDELGIADDPEKIYVLLSFAESYGKQALRQVIAGIQEEWDL